jgi:hypothetical protein
LVKKAASYSTDIDKSDKNKTKANLEDLNFYSGSGDILINLG